MVYKIKGADRTALVTDAMRGAGMTEGKTILGSLTNGQECYIEDGVAKMPGGEAFAGSVATTDRLVRNAIKAGATLEDAVRMMTSTPAKMIGMTDRGEIARGKRADLIFVDHQMNIGRVMMAGKTVVEN
jgi:N-acetylglucosamine-6-phosphate deacetylase